LALLHLDLRRKSLEKIRNEISREGMARKKRVSSSSEGDKHRHSLRKRGGVREQLYPQD